ncbi:uncharacterized protein LOC111364797 [Spodoptera litura]|uniref:Uncharacterized protein LOC111364797 n=1 Tax=Spodoptera litura TaxID=69820 RepID=A0A9J7J2W9_SPOLT|nr:uncharacterized protein LOC111364797 [Spodoptera litura]
MSHTWSTIPLLPLRCILEHLSTEDALAAMSVCRHWRDAIHVYEGHKELLKLRVKQLEKCKFVSRVFKKNVRKLHLYIDCNEPEIDKFMNLVFPQFFDSPNLEEILFIGPSYMQLSNHVPFIKLKSRVQIESLVYKNIQSLKKLGFMGCGMAAVKNENERYSNKQVEYYSRPLKFNTILAMADTILSSTNQHLMRYSTITHLIVDYEQLSTSSLITLSQLKSFRYLTLNITNRKPALQRIDWETMHDFYKYSLRVTVNIIAVPYRRFEDIMQNVLVEGLRLISLKVMFCKSLYTPLLSHISRMYQNTLQEVIWADCPYDSSDPYHRVVRPLRQAQPDTYAHVNPFVLLCWQCMHLQRLAIHGYWVWQYDLLGFVRLRKGLMQLEISAIYHKQDRFHNMIQLSEEGAIRVLCGDQPPPVDPEYVQEVNEYTDFKWRPTPWSSLHPGLRARATLQQRIDYVVSEARVPTGVQSYTN